MSFDNAIIELSSIAQESFSKLMWVTEPELLPKQSGLYVLCLSLQASRHIQVGAKGSRELPKGLYFYVGSAKGAGGLASRVGRHFRNDADKKKRWHIDYIRAHMTVHGCWILIDSTDSKQHSTDKKGQDLSDSERGKAGQMVNKMANKVVNEGAREAMRLSEYRIVHYLQQQKNCQVLEGLGSSDCRCAGHVLRLPFQS